MPEATGPLSADELAALPPSIRKMHADLSQTPRSAPPAQIVPADHNVVTMHAPHNPVVAAAVHDVLEQPQVQQPQVQQSTIPEPPAAPQPMMFDPNIVFPTQPAAELMTPTSAKLDADALDADALDAADKARGAAEAKLAETQRQLSEAMARIKEIEAASVLGGPLSIATAEATETFGKDWVGFIDSAANKIEQRAGAMVTQAVQQLESKYEARIAQLEQAIQATGQRADATAYKTFEQHLTELVPQWQQINQNPEFQQWMRAYNSESGELWGYALRRAAENGDAVVAARAFEKFAEFKQAQLAPAEQPAAEQSSLAGRVSPAKNQAPDPAAHVEGQQEPYIWTDAAIAKVKEMERKGQLTADQITATDLEISNALREGRYRPQ